MKTIPESFDSQEERLDWLYGALGICGCGIPDDVLTWVAELLRLVDRKFERGIPDDEFTLRCRAVEDHFHEICSQATAEYAIWYWLDSRGLLEHGGGIGGSWLTEYGRHVLTVIEALSLEQT